MNENNLKVIAFLGVIIGAMGLGLGALSVFQIYTGVADGNDGDDGDDGTNGIVDYTIYKTYYCSSQSQIENALANIGTGHGIIVITENIVINSQINISGGGNYIIQGAGPIIIDCNINDEVFYITSAQSLTIKDLNVNKSDSTMYNGIYVNEENDNFIYIQNVQLIGGPDYGIYISSENVWIQDCIINDYDNGIYLDTGSAHCHILDNTIYDLHGLMGIELSNSESNIIIGNIIHSISPSTTDPSSGIYLSSSKANIISNNVVNTIHSDSYTHGFYISSSHNNTFTNNVIENVICEPGTSISYGVYLSGSTFNNINDNNINYVSGSNDYGIYGTTNSEYNAIVANTISNCNTGINAPGTGNIIEHNVVP